MPTTIGDVPQYRDNDGPLSITNINQGPAQGEAVHTHLKSQTVFDKKFSKDRLSSITAKVSEEAADVEKFKEIKVSSLSFFPRPFSFCRWESSWI